MKDQFSQIQQTSIHYNEDYEKFLGAVVPPIFENTLFKFPTMEIMEESMKTPGMRYGYTRISNPTCDIAEQIIAVMEKGEAAKTYVSGVSAIFSALSTFLEKGDHVIYVKTAYGRVDEIINTYFSRFGVSSTAVEGDCITEFESSIRPNTKIIYLESPSSMILKLQDLHAVSKLAKQKGIYTIIDNTWATPVFQNPLTLGIDMVVHSVSKYLGGHSDILGGVIISSKEIMDSIPVSGSFLPPFESWLLIRSLRTLGIRMKAHQKNAMVIAQYLEKHPKILKVNYPGLMSFPQYELGQRQMSGNSGLFSFEIDAEKEGIDRFINTQKTFALGSSWGGFEGIICPVIAGKTKQEVVDMGYAPGLIRISIGLEDVDCILEDLDNALKEV